MTYTAAALRARGLSAPTLVIASDGLWDLWTFGEVASQLQEAQVGGESLGAFAEALCERTRAKGDDYFGEAADNLTAVLVGLQPYLST